MLDLLIWQRLIPPVAQHIWETSADNKAIPQWRKYLAPSVGWTVCCLLLCHKISRTALLTSERMPICQRSGFHISNGASCWSCLASMHVPPAPDIALQCWLARCRVSIRPCAPHACHEHLDCTLPSHRAVAKPLHKSSCSGCPTKATCLS